MSEARQGLFLECDGEGRIVAVPYDTIGLGGDALIGRLFPGLAFADNLRKALDFLAAVRQDGAHPPWAINVAVNGEPVTLHFSGCRTPSGLTLVASRSARDLDRLLDELSAINNDLANLNRQLSKERAEERAKLPVSLLDALSQVNNELTNAQRELARSNSELKRASEEKSRLMGVAAHDLRNPLGIISGYAEFLSMRLEGRVDPKELAMLSVIQQSSHFMLALIESILEVSEAATGKLALNLQSTDVIGLIRRNLSINGILAERKAMTIDLVAPQSLPPQTIDPLKIEQVLNNLVGNAIKFSEPGSSITVTVEDCGGRLRVAVADQGLGIRADEIGLLFKPFSRTSTRPTGGEASSGLGLAICKSILDGHGGDISVTSTLGKGTTFVFTLPLEH